MTKTTNEEAAASSPNDSSAPELAPLKINETPGRSAMDSEPPRSIRPDTHKTGRQVSLFSAVIVCLVVALSTGIIGLAVGGRLSFMGYNGLDLSSLNDVYSVLNAKYDGKLDRKTLVEGAAKGLVEAAGDEYTELMTNDEYKQLSGDLSGELNGIGVELGMNDQGIIYVVSVLDGSPAEKAGVESGDLIGEIDGESTMGLTVAGAAYKIRGDVNTKVNIKVVRGSETKEFNIIRAKIENPSVKWSTQDGIMRIRISTFGDDTADLMSKAAHDAVKNKVNGIVLDLRGNTGGYVDAAQSVASLWLQSGDVITEERNSSRLLSSLRASGDDAAILAKIPTVVLIDGSTASASEIVSGALHDHLGIKLIGTKSFGKGLVQEVVPLRSGDKLKVTVAKWYTPKGVNINKEGLKPDIEVKMTRRQYNSGDDVQMQAALEQLQKNR